MRILRSRCEESRPPGRLQILGPGFFVRGSSVAARRRRIASAKRPTQSIDEDSWYGPLHCGEGARTRTGNVSGRPPPDPGSPRQSRTTKRARIRVRDARSVAEWRGALPGSRARARGAAGRKRFRPGHDRTGGGSRSGRHPGHLASTLARSESTSAQSARQCCRSASGSLSRADASRTPAKSASSFQWTSVLATTPLFPGPMVGATDTRSTHATASDASEPARGSAGMVP